MKIGDEFIVEVMPDGEGLNNGLLVRCEKCKWRPHAEFGKDGRKHVIFNRVCPLSYIPEDDFFCKKGEEAEVYYDVYQIES